MSALMPGYGDVETWPGFSGHGNDPRRPIDYWQCPDCGDEHDSTVEQCPDVCSRCGRLGVEACCEPCLVCDSLTDVAPIEGEPLCHLCAGGDPE